MIKKKLIKNRLDILEGDMKNQNFEFLGNQCNYFDYENNSLNDVCKNGKKLWEDYEHFLNDYDYLDRLYNKILDSLFVSLNKFHGVKKRSDFWEIIIGPWLMTFCVNLYDKWKISETQAENDKLFTEINPNLKDDFQFLSIEDYKRKIGYDSYNQIIFSKIFLFLKRNNKCKVDLIEISPNVYQNGSIKEKNEKPNFFNKNSFLKLKNSLKRFLLKFYSNFTKNNEIVILRNYLGFYNNLKINLTLKQLPCFYIHNLEIKNLDENRDRKNFLINFKCNNLFEKFLLEELICHVPKTFLEKFESTCEAVTKINLPSNPKKIFVTNCTFNTFLSFYVGLVKDRNKDMKLYLAQHGGCVGQYDKHWFEDFEIKVSTKFLSYGWNSSKFPDKNIPIGFLKPIKKIKKYSFKEKKDILLIIKSRHKYINKLDSAIISNHKFDYLENSFSFINNLNSNLKKKLKIRLRDQDLGWHEHQRFQLKFPNFRFDYGQSNIFKLMKKSNIVVSTNLGTSYLESLAMNIPTIVLTNYNLEPVRDDCKNLLKLLIDSKILHLNPISAAEHINSICDKVDSWWLSKEIQKNVKIFCDKYAKINDAINIDLKKILK